MYLIGRLAFHNLTQLMECLTYLCYLRHKVTREQSTSSSSSLKEPGWLNLTLNPIQIGASSDGSAMLTQCQHNVNNPVALKCQNYLDSGKNDVAQISLSDLPPRRKNLENTSTFTWFCTTFCNEAIFSHCHLNSRLLFQHIPRNNLGHKIFVDAHNLRETKWTVTCQFLKINLF